MKKNKDLAQLTVKLLAVVRKSWPLIRYLVLTSFIIIFFQNCGQPGALEKRAKDYQSRP